MSKRDEPIARTAVNGTDDSPITTESMKLELSQTDLLHILSCLEGELEAREITITAIKAEHAKHLLHDAKYGRVPLQSDPFRALERDSNLFSFNNDKRCFDGRRNNFEDGSSDSDTYDEGSAHGIYDGQLAALANVAATQRSIEDSLTSQIRSLSAAYEVSVSELEQLQTTHAQEDDTRGVLVSERDTLRNELQAERTRSCHLEGELARVLDFALALKAENIRQRSAAGGLIRERRRLILRCREERERCNVFEAIVKELASSQDEPSATQQTRTADPNLSTNANTNTNSSSQHPVVTAISVNQQPQPRAQKGPPTVNRVQSMVAVPITVPTTRPNANATTNAAPVQSVNIQNSTLVSPQPTSTSTRPVSQPSSVVRYSNDTTQRPAFGGVLNVSVNGAASSNSGTHGAAVHSPPIINHSGARTVVTMQSGLSVSIEKRSASVSSSSTRHQDATIKLHRLSASGMPVPSAAVVSPQPAANSNSTMSNFTTNRNMHMPLLSASASAKQQNTNPNASVSANTGTIRPAANKTSATNSKTAGTTLSSNNVTVALGSRPLGATSSFMRTSPQRNSISGTPSHNQSGATATVICGGSSSPFPASVPIAVSVPVVPTTPAVSASQKPKAAQALSVNAK